MRVLQKNKKHKKSFPVKNIFKEMIFLTVAVENGLDEIKNFLSSKGFNVVDLNTHSYPVQAVVYLRKDNLSLFSANDAFLNSANGTLMINSYQKSNEDIERILKSRLYSPLF